jgi:hypothetical protein
VTAKYRDVLEFSRGAAELPGALGACFFLSEVYHLHLKLIRSSGSHLTAGERKTPGRPGVFRKAPAAEGASAFMKKESQTA